VAVFISIVSCVLQRIKRGTFVVCTLVRGMAPLVSAGVGTWADVLLGSHDKRWIGCVARVLIVPAGAPRECVHVGGVGSVGSRPAQGCGDPVMSSAALSGGCERS